MIEYNKGELESVYESVFKWGHPINLDTFNEEMTISQVIKFFAKYDMIFTKTMIQNYIRIGLIPGPVEKRYYTEDHLILLFLIYQLKESFSLEEIKTVFTPVLNGIATKSLNITCMDLYTVYSKMQAQSELAFKHSETVSKKEIISQILQDTTLIETQEIKQYMVILYLMVETVTTKHLALKFMDLL